MLNKYRNYQFNQAYKTKNLFGGTRARAIGKRLATLGVQTLLVEPGSPREIGYIESLNGKIQDGLSNLENFTTLEVARVLIESWRTEHNHVWPHNAENYLPPAPEAIPSWS